MTRALFVTVCVCLASPAHAELDADSAYHHYAQAVAAYSRGEGKPQSVDDLAWNVVLNAPSVIIHALALDARQESTQALVDLIAIRGGHRGDLFCAAAKVAKAGRLKTTLARAVNLKRCVDKSTELGIDATILCRSKGEIDLLVKIFDGQFTTRSIQISKWCSA